MPTMKHIQQLTFRRLVLTSFLAIGFLVLAHFCYHLHSTKCTKCKLEKVEDLNVLNLLQYLKDQEHIRVPRKAGQFQRKVNFDCDNVNGHSYHRQRGRFWVLYNYIPATNRPACDESITYTTHSEFTYLDNLLPLLKRWRGPVSLAVYAPASDFAESLRRIRYLRQCTSSLVAKFVSFHFFFDNNLMPRNIPKSFLHLPPINCSLPSRFRLNGTKSFRKKNNLEYPINVARNIARDMAPTHYVLVSDIELYPSPNLIPRFFDMLKRNETVLQSENPRVFVLPAFELKKKVGLKSLPRNKRQLQKMVRTYQAIPFHKFFCPVCHQIPNQTEWLHEKFRVKDPLSVFTVAKRRNAQIIWEPFFIGTKSDPGYDERLTWEGGRNKMIQGFILCVLDYDFMILNNAFLTHRPGIKTDTSEKKKNFEIREKQNQLIRTSILPQLRKLYGNRQGCSV